MGHRRWPQRRDTRRTGGGTHRWRPEASESCRTVGQALAPRRRHHGATKRVGLSDRFWNTTDDPDAAKPVCRTGAGTPHLHPEDHENLSDSRSGFGTALLTHRALMTCPTVEQALGHCPSHTGPRKPVRQSDRFWNAVAGVPEPQEAVGQSDRFWNAAAGAPEPQRAVGQSDRFWTTAAGTPAAETCARMDVQRIGADSGIQRSVRKSSTSRASSAGAVTWATWP